MASFTNLALSTSSLATGALEVAADYGELGWLLMSVASIGLLVPLVTIALVQRSRFETRQ